MTGKQKEKIYKSITDIDDKYVEEAAEECAETIGAGGIAKGIEKTSEASSETSAAKFAKRRLAVKMALGLAAAIAVAAAGIIFFTTILPKHGKAGEEARYPTRILSYGQELDGQAAPGPEIAYEKRWDEKTLDEKYMWLDYNGLTYYNSGKGVLPDRLGEWIAMDESVYGQDAYAKDEDSIKRTPAKVGLVKGVSEKVALAVQFGAPEHVSVFVANPPSSEQILPATLGAFLSDWNLAEDLRVGIVYCYQADEIYGPGYDYTAEGGKPSTICFEGAETRVVLETLLSKTDAQRLDDLPKDAVLRYSVAIYDDTLGVENLSLAVYSGGFIWTNLTGYAGIFKIGEEGPQAFLDYVIQNLDGYVPVYPSEDEVPEGGEKPGLGTVVRTSQGE